MKPFSFEDLEFEFVSLKSEKSISTVPVCPTAFQAQEHKEDLVTARNQRALDAANNDQFWDGE